MSTTFCLECEHEIELGRYPSLGQRVKCPNCETEQEIIKLDPLLLDWVYDGPVSDLGMFDDEQHKTQVIAACHRVFLIL